VAWGLALVASFVVLGVLGGHTITYDVLALVGHGDDDGGARHGYLAGLGAAGLVLLVASWFGLLTALVRFGSCRLRVARASRTTLLLALTVPPLTFAVQESLERVGTGTHPPLDLLLLGGLVQALVGLLVHALVTSTLRGTVALATRLVGSRRALRLGRLPGWIPSAPASAIRIRPLAVGVAGRAPPRHAHSTR
jgi:hypothetical protein